MQNDGGTTKGSVYIDGMLFHYEITETRYEMLRNSNDFYFTDFNGHELAYIIRKNENPVEKLKQVLKDNKWFEEKN